MSTIILETKINAPVQRCFDLSRSIDLHQLTTSKTKERAIAGVTTGLIKSGQTVTWRTKHFGVWQKLTVRITDLESPHFFKDEMIKGAFRRMEHLHQFNAEGDATLMRDYFEFEAPLGFLGKLAEKLILKQYLTAFLKERNDIIKQVAESEQWKKFLKS